MRRKKTTRSASSAGKRSKTEAAPMYKKKIATLSIKSPGRLTDAEIEDIRAWLVDISLDLNNKPLTHGVYSESFSYYQDRRLP